MHPKLDAAWSRLRFGNLRRIEYSCRSCGGRRSFRQLRGKTGSRGGISHARLVPAMWLRGRKVWHTHAGRRELGIKPIPTILRLQRLNALGHVAIVDVVAVNVHEV